MPSDKRPDGWFAVLLAAGLCSGTLLAEDLPRFDFHIPESALGAALLEFSDQSGVQIVIPDRIAAGRRTKLLAGRFTAREALRQLLNDSGLEFEFVDEATALVQAPVRRQPARAAPSPAAARKPARPALRFGMDERIDNIVVTGARVPRTDTSPASPVTILSVDDFRFTDSRNSESIINILPQVIPDGTATTNNTGPNNGSATIDLRGFGAARTLVLLNGRRIVGSTIDTTVDINSIPSGMLQRVDVVTGAASAAYGSDALAGVVNFILRDDYVGAELEAGYGVSDHGDGARYSLNGAWGAAFNDRQSHFSAFFDLSRRESVRESGRPLFRDDPRPFQGRLVPGGSTFLPGGLLPGGGDGIRLDPETLSAEDRRYFENTFSLAADGNVLLTDDIRFDSNGDPLPFVDPDDRYPLTRFIFLQLPQERLVASVRANHTLPSALTLYGDVLYSRSTVDRALAAVSFSDVRVPENSPFVSPRLRTILAQRELGDADNYFEMHFRVPESGSRTRSNRRQTARIVAGARGSTAGDWTWDAFVNVGRMDLKEIERKAGLRSRVQSALGCPVAGADADGDFVPEDCPAVPLYPDGVRINPFGAGNITLEQLDFMLADDIENRTEVTQLQAGFSIVGEAVSLPAGPIGWAFGLEFRDEWGSFSPDPQVMTQDIIGSLIESATGGSYEVYEAFGELFAPLLQNAADDTSLNLNAAFRIAEYSTVGNAFNWKLGIEWTPSSRLRLRGQYQSAIRAPNIEELFSDRRQTFQRFTDPCAGATGSLRDACVASGVSPEHIDGISREQRQIPSFQSGNPGLLEERARTVTAGVVAAPLPESALRVSLDYFNISVDNAISMLGASETVQRCLSVADAAATSCTRINRGADGAVSSIERLFENLTFIEREGVDMEFRYEVPLRGGASDFGTLDLRLLGTWMLRAASRATPFSDTVDCAGFVSGSVCGRAFPEVKTQFGAHYQFAGLGVDLRWQHIGAVRDAKILVSPENPPVIERLGARDYFDFGIESRLGERMSVRAGILNLFDEEPPLFESQVDARTDPATYDVIGRRYYVAARLQF